LLKDQPLFQVFADLKDPRVGGRCLHPLINIIFITICGLISGCDGWKAIENFGKEKIRWLSQFIDLENGVPSQLTFARVIARVDPISLERCVRVWFQKIYQLSAWDIINFDGKTACGSGHVNGEKKKMHLVNAYSPKHTISLGSERTADKSNEIKAIPILLKELNIAGTIITMDAMGTQKGIANLIREKQAHYVLALKENHKKFYRNVESTFKRADQLQYQNMVSGNNKTNDYGHQRIEGREYTILPMMYFFKHKKNWRDFQAVIRVKSDTQRLQKNQDAEISTRYYITSIPFKMYSRMCEAIRSHWSIENKLHWKLDVGMHEDDCQIYRGFADQNLAVMRKVVLALLEKEPSYKAGIELKRHKAALSTRYLRKVVGF
jgi:predicted transposase YbfD/YdcC